MWWSGDGGGLVLAALGLKQPLSFILIGQKPAINRHGRNKKGCRSSLDYTAFRFESALLLLTLDSSQANQGRAKQPQGWR